VALTITAARPDRFICVARATPRGPPERERHTRM
jgi:hypothetical protein